MQIVLDNVELGPALIHWERGVTDDEFYRFCQDNRDVRIERTAEGDLVIMPPTGGETGSRNAELMVQLGMWARQERRGQAFDSSTGFTLPNGAARSPDASWVLHARLNRLTPEQKRKLLPLAPDFLVELMSPSDRLSTLKAKMREWIDNGAQLGWLLDPDRRTAYIYRPGRKPEQVVNPAQLIGEGPVAGFVLELADIWAPL